MTDASTGRRARRVRTSVAAVCATATAGLLVAAVSGPAEAATRQLTISFDRSIGAGSLGGGLAGSVRLNVVTADGGSLSRAVAADGSMSAVRTPSYDGSASGSRAILAVENTGGDVLSPGTADLRLRADVSMDATSDGSASTDNGDNLLQRGLYGQAQYKLQVDHRVPACRVSGTSGAVLVTAPDTLAARDWYRLVCARNGSTLTLTVKHYEGGTWRVASRTTATGSIGTVAFGANVPLTVGGKLNDAQGVVSPSSDQLNGRYANILVRLG